MSKFKVLALAATFVMATAGLAIAGGDCASKASAETASASGCSSAATAETAAAKTASAEGCASGAAAKTASAEGCASKATAETAAVKTAGAEGCASGAAAQTAAVKTAGAEGCASSATVKTAGAGCASGAAAQTAGASCDSKATAQTVQIETVRMPSGAMAVFYNGTNAETVAFLQSKVEAGCAGFVCDMAKGMAADENVATEIAATEHGVMILVTPASDAGSVDKYEEQYAAVVASMDQEQGE